MTSRRPAMPSAAMTPYMEMPAENELVIAVPRSTGRGQAQVVSSSAGVWPARSRHSRFRWGWSAKPAAGGGVGQVTVLGGAVEEGPEAQHPLQGLRAVADAGLEPSAQLALADAHLAGHVAEVGPGVGQELDGLADGRVRVDDVELLGRDADEGGGRIGRVEVRPQARSASGARSTRSTRWSRRCSSGTPSPAPPAPGRKRRPTSSVSGTRSLGHGPGVGAGHERAVAAPPDQVAAAVGQDGVRRLGAHAVGPEAGDGVGQRGRWRPLPVAGRRGHESV